MVRHTASAVVAWFTWAATALRPALALRSQRIDPPHDGSHDPSLCMNMDMPESLGMRTVENDNFPDKEAFAEKEAMSTCPREWGWDVADFNLHTTNDVADFEHLQNRNILFIGDSTIKELFWDTVYTLNETANDDQGWAPLPAAKCHYQKCSDVCGGRDLKSAPHHYFHNLARCAHTASPQCMKMIPTLLKRNVTLGFIWSATPYICCNGYPGLYGAMHNPPWMDMFQEYAARAPFDDIIISTGTHDFYGMQNETQYRTALDKFMTMLDPLAKRHVMVNPQGPYPNFINKDIISKFHPKWRVIDRIHWHEHLHCNPVRFTLDWMHYKRTKECHGLVSEIFNPRVFP